MSSIAGRRSIVRKSSVRVTAEKSENGEEATVSVEGRFDYRVYDSFKSTYSSLPENSKQINVDLSGTDYIDSSALGMLLMLREHVGRAVNIMLVHPGRRSCAYSPLPTLTSCFQFVLS